MHSPKTQTNPSSIKAYLIILSFISLAISVFYYFYLKYYGGFYFVHYYEYYTKAVVITDSLLRLDFLSALDYYLHSYVDKILIFRSVPFFLLFGPSQFLFFYSNVFFNLFLLLVLFNSLLKIMPPEKSFSLTLFILSQYFFMELLASFYVDLSFFLICSIFFIYLSLFDKHPEKYNIRLILIVFLIFLTKNVSYALVSIVGILLIIYFLIFKEKKIVYVLRFLIILAAGFLLYYVLVLGCLKWRLIEDLKATAFSTSFILKKENLIYLVGEIFKTLKLSNNYFLVQKFQFSLLNFIIYPIIIFITYKKREAFWIFLFIASELFLFFLYNIKGHHHDYRFFFPFYFIYIYFIYEFIVLLFNKTPLKKQANTYLVALFSIFILFNFIKLMNPEKRVVYTGSSFCVDFSAFLPTGSKVYTDRTDGYFHFYGARVTDSYNKDISYLSKIDPRFKYKIVKSLQDADYVIGKDSLQVDSKAYKLIANMDGYHLLKINKNDK